MRRDGRPVPRLHVDVPLAAGAAVALADGQRHYLARVMRLGQGDAVRLFNGRDGEWLATFDGAGAVPEERLRPQQAAGEAWLLFAPPKKDRLRFLVEKATELGAARLQPVTTERTEPPAARVDKMRDWAIEAAEQCGRLDVPECMEQRPLAELTAGWPEGRSLLLADETGGGRPLIEACAEVTGPAALLVGPEGGFAPDELEALRGDRRVVPVSLGPHILRTETAALAALACWQAVHRADDAIV